MPNPLSLFSCPSVLIADVSSVGDWQLATGGWHLKLDDEMELDWDERQGNEELTLSVVFPIIPVSSRSTRLMSPKSR